jgi:UDP-N-acetyl-2-amino-2-deoxyglucuronate dehydrogenase
MKIYKVGIIGCGAILPRHIEAINENSNFELVALCDIQKTLVESVSNRYNVVSYTDYKQMIQKSPDINFVVIATPNSLHVEQSIYCLEHGCDILIEKPVSFDSKSVKLISDTASKNNQNAYSVLQVRLNPTVDIIKQTLNQSLLGDIRAVNFVQRWQRPYEYFTGWRSEPSIGGGTLYEVGIHYLDIIQYLFGLPNIVSSKCYQTKHKDADIEDTIYALFDFGKYGGTCEVTIAAEPTNLECSISILGSNGYLKLGGKALNIIESYNFLSNGSKVAFENILRNTSISIDPNSYGSYAGSCPNHPELYRNLEKFNILETFNVISIIENIYNKSNISYT